MDKITQLKNAIEFAKKNPDSPDSVALRRRIESGMYNNELAQIKYQAAQPKGFFKDAIQDIKETGTGIKEALTNRREQAQATTSAFKAGEQGLGRSLYQAAGQAAGLVSDVVGETVIGAAKTVLPESVESGIKTGFEKGVDTVVQTDPAQEIMSRYKKLQETNPALARDIEATLGIGSLALDVGGFGVAKAGTKAVKEVTGEALTTAGKQIEKSGVKSLEKQKTDFIRDLVRPTQTKLVKESQVNRTVETGIGPFKKSIVNPTPAEIRIEKAVKSVADVSEKNTIQQNYNIIRDAIIKEANNLEKVIKTNDFLIPKKETKSRLLRAASELKDSPLIVGDAEKMADKLLTKANQLVDKYSGTGNGILTARKEFDLWVKSQRPKAFDATADNAFTIANRTVRDTFNTLLDEKAIDKGIKASLQKQSSLYSALDNLKPKAALEADTAIGRAFDNMAKAVGIKNKVVQQIATIAGIGGLGAAATFAPAAAVIGGLSFLAYKGTQLVLKPELRIGIGKLLKQSGHLLNPADKKILENAIKGIEAIPNKQGGFVANPFADAAKKIDNTDKNIMMEFIDAVNSGKKIPKELSSSAQDIAVNAGLKGADKGNRYLANEFSKILDIERANFKKSLKGEGTIPQNSSNQVIVNHTIESFKSPVTSPLIKGDFAILTAANPMNKTLTAVENAKLNDALVARLIKDGYKPINVVGDYGVGLEPSFFIEGMSNADALKYGKMFNQESVLTKKGYIYQDGTYNPANVAKTNFDDNLTEYFSTIETSNGPVKFSIPIDFDQKLKLNTNDLLSKIKNIPNKQGDFVKIGQEKSLPTKTQATQTSTTKSNSSISNTIPQKSLKAKGEILETSLIKEAKEVSILRSGQKDILPDFEWREKVARERFDIPKLKKLSFGGSDRDVYDLQNGNVLKIAKNARGLAQNNMADFYAADNGLIPEIKEIGRNYVVFEKVGLPDANTKKMVSELKKLPRPYRGSSSYWKDINNFLAKMEEFGYPGEELRNYGDELLYGDMNVIRNWGTKNGKPILLDEGSLNGRFVKDFAESSKKGITNLSDPEFSEIYRISKDLRKKYGDIDNKTMYGLAGLLLLNKANK